MKAIRIKAFPKNKSQLKTIEEFLTKEGIDFELVDQAEFESFLNELEGSLSQVRKIQKGEINKEKARNFLNEL